MRYGDFEVTLKTWLAMKWVKLAQWAWMKETEIRAGGWKAQRKVRFKFVMRVLWIAYGVWLFSEAGIFTYEGFHGVYEMAEVAAGGYLIAAWWFIAWVAATVSEERAWLASKKILEHAEKTLEEIRAEYRYLATKMTM